MMNKHLASILVAAIATFASCSDEDLIEKEEQGKTQQMTFVASVDDDASTRTTIDSDNKVLWSAGDAISILSVGNTANSRFALSSGAGTANGTFTSSCPTSTTGYYAAYPYNEANGMESSYVKIRWNGSEQVAQDCYSSAGSGGGYETCYPEGTPMVAYTDAPKDASAQTVNVNFKHICAYFKVFIHTSVKAITISANTETDALTAQDILVDWNNGLPWVAQKVNPSNQVTLTGKDGATLFPGYYYIPVLPGTVTSGITLTLVSSTVSGTYTQSSSKEFTLVKNNVYDLGKVSVDSWHTLSGAGTEVSPYQIGNFSDLQTMSALVKFNLENGKYRSAYYQQTASIDCNRKSLSPIGTPDNPFTGVYNGNDKTISNMDYATTVTYTNESMNTVPILALFGALKTATIKNLTVANPIFHAVSTHVVTISPFVGVAYGSGTTKSYITNCKTTGSATYSATATDPGYSATNPSIGFCYGGFIGHCQTYLEMSNCINDLTMTCTLNDTYKGYTTMAGGFIGNAMGVNESNSSGLEADALVLIHRCRHTGSLAVDENGGQGNHEDIGGFIGLADDSGSDYGVSCHIGNCVCSGSVGGDFYANSTYGNVGGFIGQNNSDGFEKDKPIITNSIMIGFIHFSSSCKLFTNGGFIGNCYSNSTELSMCGIQTASGGYQPHAFCGNAYGTLSDCWDCSSSKFSFGGGITINCGNDKSASEVVTYMNGILDKMDSSDRSQYVRWILNINDHGIDLDF